MGLYVHKLKQLENDKLLKDLSVALAQWTSLIQLFVSLDILGSS